MGTFLAADVNAFRYIFIWSAIMIVMLLLAFVGYSYLKRWMKQPDNPAAGGFTLSDLRRLNQNGQISDQEYELTRNNMLASARKMTGQLPDVLPGRPIKAPLKDDTKSAPGL